jgi:hypothetical protein
MGSGSAKRVARPASFQQGFGPEVFRMEVIIAFLGLFVLMVVAAMLNKKLSEIPWF